MFATIRILTNIKSYDDYNFKCCNKILFLELRIAPNPNGVLPLYPAGDCSKTPARAVSLLTNVLSFVVFRYRHMYWFKKIWSFTLYTSQQYLSSTSRMIWLQFYYDTGYTITRSSAVAKRSCALRLVENVDRSLKVIKVHSILHRWLGLLMFYCSLTIYLSCTSCTVSDIQRRQMAYPWNLC